MSRSVEINAEQLHALVRAHKRNQSGSVKHADENPFLRRSRLDALALEHERRQQFYKLREKAMERKAQPSMILPPGQPMHVNDIHAIDITAGSIHSGYRHPAREPSMIVNYDPIIEPRKRRQITNGKFVIACVSTMLSTLVVLSMPLWAVAIAAVVLAIVGYLAVMTAQVCRDMIPASEVEQRKIDWIVNRELPPLPERYTCLDCGRFPEDCVCDEKTGKPKPVEWTEPCPGAVQTMGQQHDRCLMCNFPVQDH